MGLGAPAPEPSRLRGMLYGDTAGPGEGGEHPITSHIFLSTM